MLSLSSIHCPRSLTVTAHSSCNCSETTSLCGPLRIAVMLRLPRLPTHLRAPIKLLSLRLRPRSQRLKLRLPLNLRSLTLESPGLVFMCFLDLTGAAGLTGLAGGVIAARVGGWELI